MKQTLKIIGFLTFACLIISPANGQSDSIKLEMLNKQMAEQAKALEVLKKDVESLKETRRNWVIIPAIGIGVFSLIVAWGGMSIVRSKLKDIVAEKLSDKINVKTVILEEALKDLSKSYEAKHNKKILILSQEEGQNAELRLLLLRGGFYSGNLTFQSVNEDLNTENKDVILFNDLIGSKLLLNEIERVIRERQKQVKTYFYFGSNNALLMSVWKENYNINMTGANMPDTLVKNLINALKTYS